METVNLLDVMCTTAGSYLFNPPFDLQTDYIQKWEGIFIVELQEIIG